MKNLYNKTFAMATMWLLLLLGFGATSKAQDGITTSFAFGGGATIVDEMRYASDGNLYFVARMGGKNQFAGNNYDAGGYGQYPLQQWLFGKVSPSGTQTVLKVFDRNVDNNNLYNSLGNNHVIDKDGNLYSILTGTFPGNDYGNGFVETGYGAKIAKTSNTGVVQWVKPINTGININYGEAGTTLPNVNAMQIMDNGTIYTIIAANNKITDSGSPYVDQYPNRIIKFNANGDEVWHHEIFSNRNALGFSVAAPKQFVDNNGNMVVTITIPSGSNTANFISQGTTLTATNPYGGNYFCLMGLNGSGARTWFHSTTLGVNLKAVDPNDGTVYASYGYSFGFAQSIAPYNTLPNLNPLYGSGNQNHIWSGMLKLDIATGNISNATPNIPVPNSLRFLTSAEKLHVRSDGSLIFYAHKTAFSAIGNYLVPDNYNALIFTDANYNVSKVAQANIEKVELIAENSTNFAFADDFKTAITLGGNTLTPFLIDTDFATRFPLYASVKADSYIAQGTISQIAEPKVTKWTGAASTAWNDTGNWSNGIADVGTTALFDANTSNQPTVSAATTVGRLVINNGVIATLPANNLTVKEKLIINGTLKFPVSSFAAFGGYAAPAIEGNGTLQFDGTGSATISYFGALSQQLSLKTNVALNASGLFKTLEFTGASSKITASGTGLTITSTDANAISGASATSYIVGKLTRSIVPGTVYNFPVGTASYYLPATINTNNITGTNSLTAEVKTTNPTAPDINLGGITVNRVTNNGWWTITPNAQPTSGTYSVTLNKNNATNGDSDATKYVILKTSPAGSLYGFEGSLGNRSQTGGTGTSPNVQNAAISVSQNDLSSFNDFIIAVMSAPVAQPLAVTNSTWTGATNTAWNNAGNWSNGVPTSTVNAVIPSGLANYPLVYNNLAMSYLKSLTINTGTNVNLSNMLSVSNSIVNNGTITVNTTPNSLSGLPARASLTGTGKVVLEKPQTYNTTQSATGDMDCDLDINIGNDKTINLIGKFGGNINIISGQITARDNGALWFTPTSATSTIQITAPVNNIAGRIWKTVTGSGTYYFPTGNDQYHRPAPADGRKYGEVSITNNNITNVSQYVVWFDAYYVDAVALANGTDFYASYINSGQWNVQPNGISPSGTINLVFKTSDYTNGRADVSDYALLRKDPSGSWAIVNGAVFSQNAGIITVTANGLAPFNATSTGTKFCIGLKATTTTWTGQANNGNWNTAGNWSNGVPNSTVKAVFNGSASNFPTTNLPTSGGAAVVEIQNGATLSLPTTFTAPIINNGTIEVKGTGTFYGFGSGSSFIIPTGNGSLKFTANSPNVIDSYYIGNTIPNSVEINNPTGITINRTLNIGGNLALTAGVVTVNSGQTLNITNPNATATGSASAYINGILKRNVNASGLYTFPVGTASAYAPASIQLNNAVGPTSISSNFVTDVIQGQPNVTIGSGTVNSLLAGGSWKINPSPSLTGGSYDITLSAPLGSSTATNFVVLKRPDNYSFYTWENQGTNQPSSINGGTVTASTTGLTSFSQFGIGELPPTTLPVTLTSFTAKVKGNGVVLNWETASEVNNKQFTVYRSGDNKIFVKLGEVLSSSKNGYIYSHIDNQPLNGSNYYKLVQIDNDGKETELAIRMATFRLKSSALNLYPNPASSVVNFNGLNGKKGTINWYSTSGQQTATSILENDKTYVPANLSDGLYFIKVLLNDGTITSHKVNVYR